MRQNRKLSSVLVYVGILAVVAFALTPLLWALSTSLKPASAAVSADAEWIPSVVTLENYLTVMTESEIPRYMLNSIIAGVASVALTLAVSIPAAYSAARFRFRGKSPILFIILATSMVPPIATLLPLFFIISRAGLYDTRWSAILVYTAWQTPIAIWLLKGMFETVPIEIEEAGYVDGCTRWGAIRRLVLPLALPGIAAAAVIIMVAVWGDFVIAATTSNSQSLRLIQVGLYSFIDQYGIVWSELTAAIMVTTVPIIAVFAVAERFLVSGRMAGGVK